MGFGIRISDSYIFLPPIFYLTMDNQEFLKDLLPKLKKVVPCQWRVQSFSRFKAEATVVAYIDARECMDILNEFAVYGWHREHYSINNKEYCKVGIVMPDASIQWRADCGTQSNTEKEKGQSSDAFKRACVNFGIGSFLYELPLEKLPASDKKTDGNWPFVIDEHGKQIWDITEYINKKHGVTPPTTEKKPKLNEVAFGKLLPRVKAKEAGVLYKTIQAFQLTENQFNQLLTA